jgi:DNA (cytosine-5)-methyltransferase 1
MTFKRRIKVSLKRHNFNSVFQNDILDGARKVYEFNNDCSHYNTKSIYTLIAENFKFPDADVVIGGFPCQDFSHAGKRKGFESASSHDLKTSIDDEFKISLN